MTDRAPRPFFGITWKQGAIIAILVGLFGFLLLGQNDPTGEPDAEEAAATETGPRRPSAKLAEASPAWIPDWPDMDLDQTLSHNPFAPLPDAADENLSPAEQALLDAQNDAAAADPSADEAADDSPETAVAEFRSRGVSMIFRNKEKTCAVIGDRVIQAGDIIDGVRIVAITNSEVIVEPAGRQSE